MKLEDIFILTDEEKDTRNMIKEWAENELAPIRDETLSMNEFSQEHFFQAFNKAKEIGLTALGIPEEYGGVKVSSRQVCLSTECIAGVSPSHSLMFATNGLVAPPLKNFGTDEQKQKYLPGIATGDILGAYCQTEPGAGSDVASVQLPAKKDGDKWLLNGTKIFATLGCVANILVVIARTGPDPHKGLTAFLVDADKARQKINSSGMPQLIAEKNEHKLGIHQNPTTEMVFDDCEAELLGEEGGGWKVVMTTLPASRGKGIPPKSLGSSKAAYRIALEHAETRKQFGSALIEFGPIKHKLLNMKAKIRMSELLMWQTAVLQDATPSDDSRPYMFEASAAKLVAAVFEEDVISEAIQVLGGSGFIEDTLLPMHYRDARIDRLFEGTDEIQEKIILGSILERGGKAIGTLLVAGRFGMRGPLYTYSRNKFVKEWPFSRFEGGNVESLGSFKDNILQLRKEYIDTFIRALPKLEDKKSLLNKNLPAVIKDHLEKIAVSKNSPAVLHALARSFAVLWAATLMAQSYKIDNSEDEEAAVSEALRVAQLYIHNAKTLIN